MANFQSIKINWNWSNAFSFATLTYWFEKLWNLESINNLTSRTQQNWFRRNPRSFAKCPFLGPEFHSDYSEFSTGHIFWFPLWNFDFSDSMERYYQLDPNVLVSLKSGLFCTRYIQLKFEIELSNYRAIFNSIYNYIYNYYILTTTRINIYVRIIFKINFSSILFKIIHFK